MSAPLVSVVMSVYDGQRYLAEAVEGVLRQTLTDFEFLIIDDGSRDDTWQILARYAAQDQRIVLHRNPENIGVARSLNKLFALAQGKYLTRHDADDISAPDRLEMKVAFLEANPAVGLVSSAIQLIDASGAPLEGFDFFTKETENDALQQQLLHDCHLLPGSSLFRRQCLEAVGGYDQGLEPTEDYDLLLRIAEVTRLACLTPVLYQYRHHPESASQARFHQQIYHKAVALDRALQRRFGAQPAAPYRERTARFYLQAAFAKYRHGDGATARASLTRALVLFPGLLDTREPLETMSVDYTASGSIEADLRLAETVFADLPATRAVVRLKPWLLSRLHMREVFAGVREHDPRRIDAHLWPGVRYDPTWLFNRGVLSILVRRLLRSRARVYRIKRVYLTLYIWSEAGGMEEIVTSLACALRRAGVDVVVFAWAPVAAGVSQYETRLKANRIPLYLPRGFWGRFAADWQFRVATLNRWLDRLSPALSPLYLAQTLRRRGGWNQAKDSVRSRLRRWGLRLFQGYNVDVYMQWRMSLAHLVRPASLINQHGLGSPAAIEWGLQRHLAVVYSEGNTPGDDPHLNAWTPFRCILKRVQRVTALSEGARAGLVKYLDLEPAQIVVIPGPVEFSGPPSAAPNAPWVTPGSSPRVLFVGRLDPMKGLKTLIEAAGILRSRGATAEVLLAGDGEERESLLSLVRERALEGYVTLLGRVKRVQLPPLYKSAAIFVIPSLHFEGLGLVVPEAMSFGLPIVASNIPAVQGLVVHNYNGLLFPAGDAAALAEALEYLLDHPAERKRMGQMSRERCASGEFNPDRVAQQYLKVYQQALAAFRAQSQIEQPKVL